MRQRATADNLTICYFKKPRDHDLKKQNDVRFSCVCPVIDKEFRQNIVRSLRIHLAIALWIRSHFNLTML